MHIDDTTRLCATKDVFRQIIIITDVIFTLFTPLLRRKFDAIANRAILWEQASGTPRILGN